MPNKNVISETVVSLSADIDNAGMQKLFGLMDTNRLKAYTLAASLAAVTTGVFKFIQSITKEEFELEKLAKTKKKSVEETRAENEALKAMGMTLDEIKKDKALKSMYDDLVKFNKEMQMPSMKNALANINKLRAEFYKLKSALSYAVEAIGAQVFANIEAPMERIGGKLKSAAEWIRDNLTSIATKIGAYITGFTKGVLAIGKTVENIVNWVKELPEGIKGVALALSAVFLLLKSGPLGQILAIVTAIGDVIHDYDAYMWNKQNREKPEFWFTQDGGWTDNPNDKNIARDEQGNPLVYQAKTGGDFLWEVVTGETGETTTSGKSREIAKRLVDRLTQLFKDVNDVLAQNGTLSEILGGENSIVGQIFAGIGDYFGSQEGIDAVGQLIANLFGALSQVMATAGGWGASITQSIAGIIANLFNIGDIWNDSKLKEALNGKNGIVNGLIGALELNTVGANPFISILGGIVGGYKTARNNALEKLFKEKNGLSDDEFKKLGLKNSDLEEWVKANNLSGEVSPELMKGLQDDFNIALNGILDGLKGGIKIGSEFIGDVWDTIIRAIVGQDETEANRTITSALDAIGKDNPIWDGLTTGLTTWLASGSFLAGIFSGLGTTLIDAGNLEELQKAADAFVEMFNTLWEGAWIDAEDHSKGRTGVGLHSFIKRIFEGEDGESGIKQFFVDLGNKIVTWIEPVFNVLGDLLSKALYNALESAGIVDMFNFLGIDINNPNTSKISKDKDGNFVLTSSNGQSRVLTPSEVARIDDSHVKEKKGYGYDESTVFNLSLDKNGNLVGTNGSVFSLDSPFVGNYFNQRWQYDKVLKEMSEEERKNAQERLEQEKKYNEERAKEEQRLNEMGWHTEVPEGAGTYNENGGLIPDERIVRNETPNMPKGDVSVEPKLDKESLSQQLASMPPGQWFVKPVLQNVQPKQAWGGRIGSEGTYTVGEDGAEYIIPITKPDRAIYLIRQMLSEMGSSAMKRVMDGFGIGGDGTVGSSPADMVSAIQGMTMANTYNISAPVNINVNSNGSNAKEIGTSIYDAAERHLIKTLRGACV